MHLNNTAPRFHKTLLALASSTALLPYGAWAIDLAQAPPGTVQPYVTPNVIISIDDSGSMNYCLNKEGTSSCVQGTVCTKPTKRAIARPGVLVG